MKNGLQLECKWDLYDQKINCFVLQLITNEIYMTTKLTVALWKCENGCVKKRREKEKGFSYFPFSVFE